MLVGIHGTSYYNYGNVAAFSNATYGVLSYMFGMNATNSVSNLTATSWNMYVVCGHKNGKGIVATAGYTAVTPSTTSSYPFTDN